MKLKLRLNSQRTLNASLTVAGLA